MLGQHYYFVEYQHQESAERALLLQLGLSEGLHVYPIDGPFVEQYHSCKTRGSSQQSCHPTQPYPRIDHHDLPVLQDRVQEKLPVDNHSCEFDTPGLPRSGQDDCLHGCDPGWTAGSYLTSHSTHTSQTYVGPSIRAKMDPSQTPSLSYSLETRLVFEIQGQKQVYDLAQDPGRNPESVIELLKLSKSERGNWMTAGAYFRRKGNPRAALQVVATMVQVMYDHGYTLDSLKAAFPLLAACEFDLARLSWVEKEYSDHLDNAKSWLQMIYGEDSPTLKFALQNTPLSQIAPHPLRTSLHQPPPSHGTEGRSSRRYNPMGRTGRKPKTVFVSSEEFSSLVSNQGPPERSPRISMGYGREYRRNS